jgi:hypothetical protein
MLRFYRRMINWMHTKSKEFGDTDCSCFKIEWDCLCEGCGNPSCLGVCGRVCLFGFWFTVDRHGLGALAMTTHSLSLRGGSKSERRGNPWCLRGHGRGCLFAYWFTEDRHGLSAFAMTSVRRGRDEKAFCHCEEDDRTMRQSIGSRWDAYDMSVRLLVHSGSPRAFSPRDEQDGRGSR